MARRISFFIIPVNIDSILPSGAGLVDQRLSKDIEFVSSKLFETDGAIVIIQALVKERVSESSWNNVSPTPLSQPIY
jgi:hypothetical protein